jgi:hypothetical protein
MRILMITEKTAYPFFHHEVVPLPDYDVNRIG